MSTQKIKKRSKIYVDNSVFPQKFILKNVDKIVDMWIKPTVLGLFQQKHYQQVQRKKKKIHEKNRTLILVYNFT